MYLFCNTLFIKLHQKYVPLIMGFKYDQRIPWYYSCGKYADAIPAGLI